MNPLTAVVLLLLLSCSTGGNKIDYSTLSLSFLFFFRSLCLVQQRGWTGNRNSKLIILILFLRSAKVAPLDDDEDEEDDEDVVAPIEGATEEEEDEEEEDDDEE